MADDATVLLGRSGQIAGHVHQGHQRDLEGIAEPDEPGRFHRRVDVDRAGQHFGLVAHDADRVAAEPPEADDDVLGEERLHLQELAVIDDARDDVTHVVRQVGAVGNDALKLGVGPLGVVSRGFQGRLLAVAGGQERQQLTHLLHAFLFGLGQEMRDA